MAARQLIVLLCLLLTAALLPAQTHALGSENNLQLRSFSWKSVQSEHFTVNYYAQDPVLATQVARYAEEALYDLGRRLEYRQKGQFGLYLFQSAWDWAQSNRSDQREFYKVGGITPLVNNTADVIAPGTSAALQQAVKTQVAALILHDFYFGGEVKTSIKNTVLLHVPDWFDQGLPAYLGEGWSYADEMWMSSLAKSNLLDLALEGNDPIHHVARKSIWHYIAVQHGPEKLREIFYLTKLTLSVESGIIHSLGITPRTLTERWREFILRSSEENRALRLDQAQASTQLRLPAGYVLRGFARHPMLPEVAVMTEKEGRLQVWNLKTGSGALTALDIEGGYRTSQFRPWNLDFPLAWSADGRMLAGTIWRENGENIWYYDALAKSVTYLPVQPGLDHILSLNFSHDGKQIAVSAQQTGSLDLFVTTPGSNRFRALTHDPWDELSPVWSVDDQQVFFSSNRASDSVPERVPMESYRAAFDLWRMNADGASLPERITHTPETSEYPVCMLSSFEMVYSTDENGIQNLARRNVFMPDSSRLTNLSRGFQGVSWSDSLVVFSSPLEGVLSLFQAVPANLNDENVTLDTRWRAMMHKAWLTSQRQDRARAVRDSIAMQPEPTRDTVPAAAPDTNRPRTTYYLFDEASTPVRTNRKNKPRNTKNTPEEVRPDFNAVQLKGPVTAPGGWAASQVTTAFHWDPVYKMSIQLESEWKKLDGNQRFTLGFRPYSDLRSGDFYARLLDQKRKTDFYSELLAGSRYLNRNGFAVRSSRIAVETGVLRPLSRYLSASAGLQVTYLNRIGLNQVEPENLDGNDILGGVKASLTWDHTVRIQQYSRRGTWATARVSNAFSAGQMQQNFFSFHVEGRNYLPVLKRYTLATRLMGGASLGPEAQQFFMGGTEDLIFGKFNNVGDYPISQDISAVWYMDYLMPLRGFSFNARNGTKYAMANVEFRIPVSRNTARGLNSNPLFNFELIPFLDVGTVWRQGNPLSQRNPIDTKTIDSYPVSVTVQTLKSPFLAGAGVGARLVIFGYSVRTDLAWGIDDYTLQPGRLQVSLGKNF